MSDVDLAYLKAHYSDAYWITRQGGRFVAERRDDRSVVVADTPWQLLDEIREDSRLRPVQRDQQ